MASEFSFDIMSVVNMQEVDNAVNQVIKEISQRFDFKGTKAEVLLDKEKKTITLAGDNEPKLKTLIDMLQSKMIKRSISIKALSYGKIETALGGTVRQVITLQSGISQDKGKEISKAIRDSGVKVHAQIQGEQLRVSGKSKDDLQKIMSMLNEKDFGIALQFGNYR